MNIEFKYAPLADVVLVTGYNARILEANVGPGGLISYLVVWWVGGVRNQANVFEDEIKKKKNEAPESDLDEVQDIANRISSLIARSA